MKFYYSFSLLLALIANTKAAPQEICLAKCSTNEGDKECVFKVSRNIFTSELGYYTFEGADGDCGGPNPTLGIEKGVTYRFIQENSKNYYHPLGFAYGPDGALDDQDELEPGVSDFSAVCISLLLFQLSHPPMIVFSQSKMNSFLFRLFLDCTS